MRPILDFFKKHYVYMIQALMVGVVVVSLLILVSSLYQVFGRKPPVHLIQLDPENLGGLCPGAPFIISVRTEIRNRAIISYYLSVMTKTEDRHLIGTQSFFQNYPYPHTGPFFQSFPWTVPNLPPGDYMRVLAAIGTNGGDQPEMIDSLFTIRKDCSHYGETKSDRGMGQDPDR